MHTNATISIDSAGTTATLSLDDQTLKVQLLDAPTGARFSIEQPVRPAGSPAPATPDQENPGVSVLAVSLGAGTYSITVLFTPQWPGLSDSDYITPRGVSLDSWSLTSHSS